MKKKLSMLLVVALVLALMVPAFAETVSLAYKGGALNLRKGPGTEYASVGYVKHGSSITVLSKGSVWSKVKTSSGKVGYIKNLYIKSGDKNYASGTSYTSKHFEVKTTGNVNFRAGASTGTKSMGVLPKGTKLTVLGENGKFYLVVNSEGTQGYVSKSYCSKTGSSSSNTMTITGKTVNMRKSGSKNSAVVTVLTKGTTVTVLKRGNYWTQVKANGKTGWVKNTYLK